MRHEGNPGLGLLGRADVGDEAAPARAVAVQPLDRTAVHRPPALLAVHPHRDDDVAEGASLLEQLAQVGRLGRRADEFEQRYPFELLPAQPAGAAEARRGMADAEGGVQLGFIADEVEKVIPELVGTMPDGTKFIRNGMDAIQTAAIRELARKLEAAERRIAALEAKVTVVKARKR